MGKLIFLDTNIYLHYQPFYQINWLEILKAENITIIVPPITIRELNKHKDSNQQARVRNRAGVVIKKLFEIFETNSNAMLDRGVGIRHEDREPLINFEEYILDRNIQDDNLIASALATKFENPNDEILIITSDFGLNLLGKARRLEIQTVRLPEKLKLPDDLNLEEKEIKKLEEEIRILKNKIPKLSLVFSNGQQHKEFDVEKPTIFTKELFDTEIEKLRLSYPKLNFKDTQDKTTSASLNLMLSLSKDDVEQYNNELEVFFENFRKYLEYKFRYQKRINRTLKLEIVAKNEGDAPADDIDVFMHFPDGFKLIEENDFSELSDPPRPPQKPRSQYERLSNMSNFLSTPYIPPPNMGSNFSLPSNISSYNIKRTKSYDVDFQIQRLKQKISESADVLYLEFDSYDTAQSFHINYNIIVATPPCEFSGVLHVVVNKK